MSKHVYMRIHTCMHTCIDSHRIKTNTYIHTSTGTGIGTRKRGSMIDERLEKLQMERGMLNNSR